MKVSDVSNSAHSDLYSIGLRLHNSAGTETWRVDAPSGIITATVGTQGGWIEGNAWRVNPTVWERTGAGGPMQINSGTGGSYLTLRNYGIIVTDHTGAEQMRFGAGGANINATNSNALDLQVAGTSRVKANATGLGFFAATPVAKPTVTGSRGGNAALASLLTALANLGLITDSSTA